MKNFTGIGRNYCTDCVTVCLSWKVYVPLESHLSSKPKILLSVFGKYVVVMTRVFLLHPVYQQEAFMDILYTGSPCILLSNQCPQYMNYMLVKNTLK